MATVVLPVYNEGKFVIGFIYSVLGHIDEATKVLIVDDSDDETTGFIMEHFSGHERVLYIRGNGLDLGNAIVKGLRHCVTPICVVMDSDGQHPAIMARNLIELVRSGVDIGVGSRNIENNSPNTGFSLARSFISWTTKVIVHIALPETKCVKDISSGLFALNTDRVNIESVTGDSWKVLISIISASNKCNVVETPYRFLPRLHGKTKFNVNQIVRLLLHIFNIKMAQNKIRNRNLVPDRGNVTILSNSQVGIKFPE